MAFHCAVNEKADMEKIPLDAAANRTSEDIRHYRQLGGLKPEHNKVTQQICLLTPCIREGVWQDECQEGRDVVAIEDGNR